RAYLLRLCYRGKENDCRVLLPKRNVTDSLPIPIVAMPLRFTIRDLLWLTLVVAFGMAAWLFSGHISSLTSETESMQTRMREIGPGRQIVWPRDTPAASKRSTPF